MTASPRVSRGSRHHTSPDVPPAPPTNPTRGSQLRARLGAALQRQRLRRRLTQGQLSELADLSLKYVGEIERGEANTTLDVVERLADALEWDPMEALEGVREPITEGIRRMLIAENEQTSARAKMMMTWLEALDPALHEDVSLARLRRLTDGSVKSDSQSDDRRAPTPRGRRRRQRA